MRAPGHAPSTFLGTSRFHNTLQTSNEYLPVETLFYVIRISGIFTNLTLSMIALSQLHLSLLRYAPKSCQPLHSLGPLRRLGHPLLPTAPRKGDYQLPLRVLKRTINNHQKSEDMSFTSSTQTAVKM